MKAGMKFRIKFVPTGAALLLALSGLPARGAEHVYLRSGFDLVCDHQQTLDGRTRLYLTDSDTNFLEVAPDDIVRTEIVAEARKQEAKTEPTAVNLPTLLDRESAAHRLDPDLLASVVRAESGGKTRVVSRAGAQGLMQLMPSTAAFLGVKDSFAPEQNIAGGAAYLDALLMYYHENIALALAAYNAGPAAVDRYRGIPPYAETRNYVARVIHDFNRRKLRELRLGASGVSQVSALSAAR